MKFSIITPTHKRPEQLLFCINSILNQDSGPAPAHPIPPSPFPKGRGTTPFDIEIIIINDSPNYDYSIFENDEQIKKAIKSKKVIYIKNKKNYGKNYSCNLALTKVTGDYIIFLDDDDWLAPNSLSDVNKLITQLINTKENLDYRWLVTNRAQAKDTELISLTQNNTKNEISHDIYKVNYFWDCMIFKRFHGDATHIIEASLAKSAHFNKKVKNGKEWYYFAQLTSVFIYKDLNSTITNGYHDNGLSDKLKTKSKIQKLITTIYNLFIYMRLRVGKLIRIKNIYAKN